MFSKRAKKGQALVLIVLAIVGLIGLTALAIDGGNAFMNRRHAQAAADAAALAAAYAKVNKQTTWTQVGLDRAASNGYTNDGVNSTVTVVSPPGAGCKGITGPYIGNNEYVQVTITSTVSTYFAPIVGINQTSSCVEAIARAKPPTNAPIAYGNALVSLNCTASRAFNAHGNATLHATGGGIYVNSNSSSGLYSGGASGVYAPSYTTVGNGFSGSFMNDSGGAATVTVSAQRLFTCPNTLNIPIPTCSGNGSKSGDTVTPGNIPASYLERGANLQPGIYCISGNAKVNAQDSLTGDNVLLYFIDGSIDINGGATVQLTGRLDGTYAGLLLFSPITNNSQFTWNGNSSSRFYGTIIALGSQFSLLGTGAADGFHSQIVADTIEYGGTGDGTIYYEDNRNYDAPIPPQIDLVR